MVTHLPLGRLLATLAVSVMVAPVAAIAQQDLRSPDTRDAGVAPVATTDLRTPDSRDAASSGLITGGSLIDLRTPDARDAAAGVVVASTPVAAVKPAADSFDWGDALIGAAAMLALVAVLGGAALLFTRRRRPVSATTARSGDVTVRHHGRVRRGTHARRHTAAR